MLKIFHRLKMVFRDLKVKLGLKVCCPKCGKEMEEIYKWAPYRMQGSVEAYYCKPCKYWEAV
jgi:predicted RNA-binding Zn-ribbon protein involved in translation (DUF1610 family)